VLRELKDPAGALERIAGSDPEPEETKMTRWRPRAVLIALALPAVAGTPGALADGLPVTGVEAGPGGVSALGGEARYVALPAGRGTVVARIDVEGGRVPVSRFLPRRLVVPVVAFDGSVSGLSADGRTLVLIRPRLGFPQRDTTFAVLDADRLRVRRALTLRGDFSFDALSPDGRWLYLIQYVSPRDITRYRVRAYDLQGGRLLRAAVVDPRESPDEMRGTPVTRTTSRDGRWAYTLYDGSSGHPFVHALDTVARRAVCVDLHALARVKGLSAYRLSTSAGGRRLIVRSPARAAAEIDTRTFVVSGPVPVRAPAPAQRDDPPWTLLGATLIPLAGAAAVLRRRRAR
jgi:hypothetical protein